MALLAVLDIDDNATEKIKRTKGALEDLVQTAQRAATAMARAQTGGSSGGGGGAGGGVAAQNQQLVAMVQLLQQSNAGMQTLIAAVNALGQAQRQQQQQGGLESGLKGMAVQAAFLSAALYKLAGDTRGLLEDAAKLAARIETLGVVTQITAKNAGYTTAELTGQAAAIRKLGITTEEATDAVLQFVRSNLSLGDAAKLARVAQDLAVVAGENSSQTFERLTRAIQTNETMLLRQVGIVTTNEQLWASYARELGKSVQQLTAAEKQQAFVNRILEEGAKVTGAYESSMETASKQMNSMTRLVTELKLRLGNELLPAFTLIIGILFKLLEALNKIDPIWIKLFASIAAGVAAMAAFASGVTAVVAVVGAFTAVLGAALGPVGLIAAAIGVLTAAFVMSSSASEVSVQKLGAMAAELDLQTTTIEKANKSYLELTAKHVELGAKTEKQTDDQKKLRQSIDELAKAVPSARVEFDLLTGSYKLNEEEIQRVLKLNEDLRLSYEKSAAAQLLASQREVEHVAQDKASAQKDVNRARDDLATAEKELRDLETQINAERSKTGSNNPYENTARISRMESAKAAVRSAEDALISYAATLTDLDRKERILNVTIANTERTLAEISKKLPDRIAEIQKGVTKDWDKFVKQAKDLGVNISAAFDEKNFSDLDKYRQLIVGLQGDVQKAGDAQMKRQTAYTQAFNSALDNIRSSGNATRAQLDAVNKGLSEVGEGTEEYRIRVQRAASAIGQFNKLSLDKRKNLDAIAKAAAFLKATELEKWIGNVTEQFDKMGLAGAEAMNKVSQGFSGDVTAMFRERAEAEYEARRESAEKIDAIDKEIADQRAERTLEGVDLAIYQEKRRVQNIEQALEREIAARDRVQKKTEEAFEDRVRQALAEVREVERSIKMQMDMREEQIALELRYQYITGSLSEQEANEKLAKVKEVTDAARAELAERSAMRQQEISEEAEVGRRRLQQSRTLNETLAKDQRSALDRQRAASAETVQQMRRDNSVIFQLTRDLSVNLAESVTKGFLDILTQARSTKDAFIGIVRSMANTVLGIIQDMISQWIRKAALLATSGGGFNVRTFLQAFTGGGGGMGAAGNFSNGGLGSNASSLFGNVAMSGGTLGMGGTSAGAGASGGGAGAALAGGALVAGGSYAVGSLMASKFGRDSYFHSGGVGAASGAGTGAAIGAMVGGPVGAGVGAGVGAIAGAIGGWLQERKRRKEMAKERDAIIEDMGGLDEFKRKAEEAGVALDKFLSTKKSKEYAAEMDKIQKAFTALDVKKFIEAQGGLDAIKEKAKAAGIELTAAFLDGTGEAADMQRELEKVAKALQLQEAKDGLAKTVTQMDELRKRAVLAGYDLRKLYEAKTIEEFNNEQAKLNKLLEEQQLRMQGLSTAAAGIKQRVEGLIGTYTKQFDALIPDKDKLKKATEEAGKNGYQGSEYKYARENAKDLGIDVDKLNEILAHTQKSFDRVGNAAMATFGGILRETGDIGAAINAIMPALDDMAAMMDEMGIEAKGSLKFLMQFRTTIKDNQDVAASLSGISQILKGLSDAGRLTAGVFNDMGADAAEQWQIMKDRGVAADQALLLMQPTLQSLYEAQKNYGFATDEATQKLIDMGIANGVVGDQFQSVNQKMLDMLMLIAEALGADIPEAYRRATTAAQTAAGPADAAAQAAQDATEAQQAAAQEAERAAEAQRVANEAAQKAADEAAAKQALAEAAGRGTGLAMDDLQEKTESYDEYLRRTEWSKPYERAQGGIVDMNNKFGDAKDAVRDFADYAVDQLARVEQGVNAISFGRSPGGLKEIRLKTRDAMEAFVTMRRAAERDLGEVEGRVNAVNDAYAGDTRVDPNRSKEPRQSDSEGGGVKIQIVMPAVNMNMSATDTTGLDALSKKMTTTFLRKLDDNADQIASRVAKATSRYRR